MRTYRLFKTIDNYKCEDYLYQVTNTRYRITLVRNFFVVCNFSYLEIVDILFIAPAGISPRRRNPEEAL